MQEAQTAVNPRRAFVVASGACLGMAALMGPAAVLAASPKEAPTMEVTPTEDLMREHGVLRRLMLIYDDLAARLKQGAEFPLAALTGATGLVQRFIQDYHEKDEEDYLFTRFNKAGKMVDLVKTLWQQHEAGRRVTAHIKELSSTADLKKPADRQRTAELLLSFNRMYRPHAAWEDTVLYPAFRSVLAAKDFVALGEVFEDKEQKLFGKNGFEKIVAEVAALEQQLGLYNLAQFTPRI
jgi:hemerythrin-like domain-containing protein